MNLREAARRILAMHHKPAPELKIVKQPGINFFTLDSLLLGCELLPDDKAFLINNLPIADKKARAEMLWGYHEQWMRAKQGEPQPASRQTAGRRAANDWLRKNNK